mmetsp:Transcript_56004/g.103610  ORF Transcript_56004/g.103610 Transcript_56004/m.103610 type:complete len:454 (-) Transcript_56004:4-1365(-)
MAPVETKLYDLLEVGTTATDADLRRAYRKLALRLHPDKGGNPDEFKRMKDAYDVLSDPHKRNLYDKYGPEVVGILEGNASPTLVMMALARVGMVERCCFLCLLVSLFLIILSPLILLSLRWDQSVMLPWFVVFAPLWVFQIASLCLVCTCVQVPPPDEEEEAEDEMRRMYHDRVQQAQEVRLVAGASLLYAMVAEVAIALKLQGSLDISWFWVLLPWALTETTLLFVHVRRAPMHFVAVNPEAAAAAEARGSVWKSPEFWTFLLHAVLWGCVRLLTYFLVAARGDNILQGSWMMCAIPLTVGEIIEVTQACMRSVRQRRGHASSEDARQGADEDEGAGAEGCVTCIVAVFWLSIFYCAAFKLDGSRLSAFLVFSPIFTCMGAIACCFACVACSLSPERVSEESARCMHDHTANYGAMGPQVPSQVMPDASSSELTRNPSPEPPVGSSSSIGGP